MFSAENARANFEDEAAERFGTRQVALAVFQTREVRHDGQRQRMFRPQLLAPLL